MTKQEREEVKNRAGVKPYQSRLKDLKANGSEYRGSCPWHEATGNHDPSLAVYKGKDGDGWHFKCMSRDCAHGDVIAFVQKIDKLTFADALRILANDAGIAEPAMQTNIKKPTEEEYETARQYLLDHGVSMETAKDHGMDAIIHPKLGLAISMPYDADPQVIKYRCVGIPKDKNSKFSHASGHPSEDLLYNIKRAEKEIGESFWGSTVYVVESERDCLMMASQGYTAVSVSSASTCVDQQGQLKIDEDQLSILARADHIYLALDQDPAGQKCADAFEINPAFNSIQVHRIQWDYRGKRSNDPKDVGDLYKQDPASFFDKIEALSLEARNRPPKWRQQFCTVGELTSGPIVELIHGFLIEGNIGIGGLSGAGKTFLALSIAKSLTTGRSFVGRFKVPQIVPVLYLIPEVGKRQFEKRLAAFQIPDDENLFLCRTLTEGPTLPLDHPFVLEAVRQLHKPVVILDTAIRFSEAKDENSANDNRWMEKSIRSLREAGCIAVIALHHSPKHLKKGDTAPTLENTFRGTGDIGALLDIAYSVRTDRQVKATGEGEQVTIECVKARDFEDIPARFNLGLKYKKAGQHKLQSYIEETGDLVLMAEEEDDLRPMSDDVRDQARQLRKAQEREQEEAKFIELVQADPAISVRTLQRQLGRGRAAVNKISGRLGYEIENGVWTAPPELKSKGASGASKTQASFAGVSAAASAVGAD